MACDFSPVRISTLTTLIPTTFSAPWALISSWPSDPFCIFETVEAPVYASVDGNRWKQEVNFKRPSSLKIR